MGRAGHWDANDIRNHRCSCQKLHQRAIIGNFINPQRRGRPAPADSVSMSPPPYCDQRPQTIQQRMPFSSAARTRDFGGTLAGVTAFLSDDVPHGPGEGRGPGPFRPRFVSQAERVIAEGRSRFDEPSQARHHPADTDAGNSAATSRDFLSALSPFQRGGLAGCCGRRSR